MAVTLAQLRTRCQQRVDMVNSSFATTAEINQLINTAGARLHALLVTAYEDYFFKTTTFSLPAAETYDLSANVTDLYKIIQVFLTIGSGTSLSRFALRRFNANEVPQFGNSAIFPATMILPVVYYCVQGGKMYFEPIPTSSNGYSVELWYAPQFTQLVNDTDTLDYSFAFGWEEYIVNDVAINLRLKEESDVSGLIARQNQFEQQLQAIVQNRDVAEASRVVDVDRRYSTGNLYAYY